MDSYSRIPPDRNTDIDDGDEGDGAGGLFEKGYGTVNKSYLVMDVIQIQNMSEALVKGKMIYFQLGADIDMKCFINKKYYFLFLILLFAGELPAKSSNLDKTKPEDIIRLASYNIRTKGDKGDKAWEVRLNALVDVVRGINLNTLQIIFL